MIILTILLGLIPVLTVLFLTVYPFPPRPIELTATRLSNLGGTTEAQIWGTQTQIAIQATETQAMLDMTATIFDEFDALTAQPSRPTATPTIHTHSTDMATVSPTALPCFWNFAYGNEDTEGAELLQTTLYKAGYDAEVRLPAFGEDYVCGQGDDMTRTFHLMDVSPEIVLTLEDAAMLNDEEALGQLIIEMVELIETTDIPRRNRLQITFVAGGDEVVWMKSYMPMS